MGVRIPVAWLERIFTGAWHIKQIDCQNPSPDTISPPRVERVNAWASLKDVFDRLPTVPEDQLGEHVPHEWIRDHPGAQLPQQQ